jgi:hypothetical protein
MVVQKSSLWPGRGFSCEQSCCPDKFYCKLGYRFQTTEAEFLDEILTKVFRVFLLAVHSHINSFALRFLHYFFKPCNLLRISTVQLLYTAKEKRGKPLPLPYGLRNPSRNLNSENSQDYAQKPQRKLCSFMNSASVHSTVSSHRP